MAAENLLPELDRERRPRSWGPLLAALAIGGALALGGFLLADGGADKATGAAPPAPTSSAPPATTPAVAAFGDLPPGYVAVNDRVGARPERIMVREETMFVSFTTAVRSGLDPEQTAGFSGGLWTARLRDGRGVPAIGEFTDPFARGTFTLAFSLDGFANIGNRLNQVAILVDLATNEVDVLHHPVQVVLDRVSL